MLRLPLRSNNSTQPSTQSPNKSGEIVLSKEKKLQQTTEAIFKNLKKNGQTELNFQIDMTDIKPKSNRNHTDSTQRSSTQKSDTEKKYTPPAIISKLLNATKIQPTTNQKKSEKSPQPQPQPPGIKKTLEIVTNLPVIPASGQSTDPSVRQTPQNNQTFINIYRR